MRQYFANHFGSFNYRSSDFHFAVFVRQQHFIELNSCATLCCKTMNKQFLSGFCLELLSLNFYNYVHLFFYSLQVTFAGWNETFAYRTRNEIRAQN